MEVHSFSSAFSSWSAIDEAERKQDSICTSTSSISPMLNSESRSEEQRSTSTKVLHMSRIDCDGEDESLNRLSISVVSLRAIDCRFSSGILDFVF